MSNKIEKYTKYAEDIANDDRHGYSQVNRCGNPDFDCSGLVITSVEKSGIPVKTKGASYTGNMYSVFKSCGFTDVTSKVNRSNASGMQRGDVLLTPGHHTAIYCGNGKLVEASCDENGGIEGKIKGDQTGKEIWKHNYYNFSGGWTYVLRYTKEDKPKHDIEYKATEKPKQKDESLSAKFKTLKECKIRQGAGKTFKQLVTIPKNTIVTCDGSFSKSIFGYRFLYVTTTYQDVKYTGFCYIGNLERTLK